MAAKTYRKTALVTAEQFLPTIGQIPRGVFSNGNGDPRKRYDCEWVLNTKEGQHYVRGGDYICTGPAGEQWNVAQEIFEATYEEVENPSPAPNAVTAGQGVEVKPLEWSEAPNDDGSMWRWKAGDYGVTKMEWGSFSTFDVSRGHWLAAGPFATLDAAKAAAQADFDKSIRSALALPLPVQEERVEQIRAAYDQGWKDSKSEPRPFAAARKSMGDRYIAALSTPTPKEESK